MAEYELPPLRIKIVGDGKSWEKTTEQTIKQARQLAASLEKIGSTVKASIINKSVRQAVSGIHNSIASHISGVSNNLKIAKGLGTQGVRRAMRDAVGNILTHVSLHIEQVASLTSRLKLGGAAQVNRTMRDATKLILHYILIGIRKMVVSAHSVRVAGASQVNKTMRDANKLVLHYILINIRRMVVSAHSVKSAGSGTVNRVMRQALDVILHSLITRIRMMAVTAHTVRGNAAPLRREVRSGINTIINYIIQAVRGTITQALSGINIRQFVNNLRRGVQAGINNTRFNPSPGNQNVRGRTGRSGSSGRGDGGMGFLGDRADIYMHINAVRNLASAWSSPLRALTEYQTRVAGLAPQLGGTGQAESFLQGMRGTTTGQVYGAEIPTAATRLLGANVDLQTTKELLASIGDIAGGDADRFQGLARAFSQVAAQGNLQGDELEQLAEQNFPLLQLMSQRTGIAQDVLREKMAKRQITAQAVFATVKAETAQGGKYAGMLNSLSNTLGVAVQRVRAFYDALQVEVMKTVADQLVKYVNKLASGIVHITNWVNANQDVVKSYVELALKISAGIVLFHAVGFAVAMVSWQMHALRRILSLLHIVTMAYNGVNRILIATCFLLRGAVMATVASMFICRAVMAGLVATSVAWYSGVAALTTATWAYVASTRVAGIALSIWNALMVRSVILSRSSAVAYMVVNTALQVVRGTLAALRIGAILTWLAFLWPVAAVIAAILAVVGTIQIAINAMGSGGFMGAIYGAWDAMKQFAINTIGFFMNIGHNSQVVAKYIYDNFWALVSDLGVILQRLFENFVHDSMLSFDTVSKLFGAFMGWLVANAPAWGYAIVNGLWNGFVWLFGKIKTGFAMVWEYATTGKLSMDFQAHLEGLGESAVKGATEGFLPAAAEIIKEHQGKSALLNNWDFRNSPFEDPDAAENHPTYGDFAKRVHKESSSLKSPAIEGLKFDWKAFDMLGLADKIPDVDFGGGAIPGQDGTDIAGLFGAEKAGAGAGKSKSTAGTPMAVRAGSAEFIDAWDSIRMAQGDPSATANAQIAANTGQTNVILNQIKQSMTKPSSNWTINAGPALP
jgi:tape measure domain-containing protein